MIGPTIVAASTVLGLSACGGGGDPAARGTGVHAKKLGPVPNAIAFWDPRRGLLGTGTCVGTTYESCRNGTIQLTSDGGRSFRVLLRTRRRVVQVQTAGPHGAIATTDGGGFRTLDGGRSWKRFRHRYGASFATERIGLGFRSHLARNHLALALFATSDGGQTWRRRASPCTQAVAAGALIDLVTPRLGWIVCLGQPGAGNEEKAVFRTTNGGQSWSAGASAVTYPRRDVHGGLGGYGYPAGIAFAADGFGILWESRGTLYVTRDRGLHWRAEPKVARPELDFGRGAAAFAAGRGLVLLGRGGSLPARLLATDDAGRTWHLVHRWG
jgi:photosystem II stability/assembly factor-like uncharacterized protein